MLLGIERARALGATEVELVNDSELVARQLQGVYKVKHPAMRPLHLDAMRGAARASIAGASARCRREHNAHADALVNQALDEAA